MANPWEGENYGATRLLLLGESAYSWDEDGEIRHPSPEHPTEMVKWLIEDFSRRRIDGRFMVTLSRALANEESPTSERLESVWDKVAFTNYVQSSVGIGPRVRPSDDMWREAKESFPKLLEHLKPQRIVVLGKTMWGKMPPAHIIITDDVQGYRLSDGSTCMCWAVNHPSRGLSWRELASIVQFACEPELRG